MAVGGGQLPVRPGQPGEEGARGRLWQAIRWVIDFFGYPLFHFIWGFPYMGFQVHGWFMENPKKKNGRFFWGTPITSHNLGLHGPMDLH